MNGAVAGTGEPDSRGRRVSGQSARQHAPQTESLFDAAHLASREIRLRAQLAPQLDEARWMILLDIYLAMADGRETPFMSAAHASSVAVSTAQRYIHEMIADGLIAQHKSGTDQRVSHLILTSEGQAVMTRILEATTALRARLGPGGR